MSKTNWVDPGSSEITSPLVAGLQEAVGKLEDALDLSTTAETDVAMSEVYIATDRYRIYQVADGKRNWLASPAPVIKKNSVVISSGFTILYGGGAIVLSENALSTDTFTASFTRTTATSGALDGKANSDVVENHISQTASHKGGLIYSYNNLGGAL